MSAIAMAQPGDKDGKKGDGPYAEMRERILKEFDKDGDGKLSDEEREAARGKVRELRMAAAKNKATSAAIRRKEAAAKAGARRRRGARPT